MADRPGAERGVRGGDAAGRARAPPNRCARWGLFQDAADPALFVETFTVSTWSEHLRQRLERGIASDKELEDRALAFLVGEREPRVRHLLWSYDR